MRKILGFTAVAAVAAGIGLFAVPAWATTVYESGTILSVKGFTSDLTLPLAPGQIPQDITVNLSASATYLVNNTSQTAPGTITFERVTDHTTVDSPAGLINCVTKFQAHYLGGNIKKNNEVTATVKASDSPVIAVTLVGENCPAPSTEPTEEPTEEPSDTTSPVDCLTDCATTPPVDCPTDCSSSTSSAAPGTSSTTVVYVQQPVEVVRVSSSGTGSPQFTG